MINHNSTDVKVIAEHLRWTRDKGYSTAILIGAGMSFSAGIPLAKGITEAIKKDFPALSTKAKKETYPEYMSLLGPQQRKTLIGKYVDESKINIAHLYLGALVKEKYIDRILTTNFDPLIIRSLALFNKFPAVYDFAASQKFVPGESADLSVYYLHGQRDGFVLLNTEKELQDHGEKLKEVFSDSGRKRCWIIIGYSGENDPVFDRLAEYSDYSNKLFWIGYNESPAAHVEEKILSPSKCAYFLGNQDADLFFLDLARELPLDNPQILSRPFSHLRESLESVADLTKDDKVTNLTTETKKWIDKAVRLFENREDCARVMGTKDELINDEIVRRAREIFTQEKYDELESLAKEPKTRDNTEARRYIAYTYNDWGVELQKLNQNEEAIEKYQKALEYKPELAEAYNNWGAALSALGRNKEAIEKYQKALEYKPGYVEAYNNWGAALSALGRNEEAIEKYQKAIEYKPDYADAYYNWGNALSALARIEEAIEKYQKAIEYKLDYADAYNNWGVALSALGRNEDAIEKHQKALEYKPDDASAYYNWGIALSTLGRNEEAIEKYQKALEYKPDLVEAYTNWGAALSELGRNEEAIEKYRKAVEYKPDDADVYTNWGTALSRLGRNEDAIEKYQKALEYQPDHASAYNNWGVALSELGRYEEAIEKYQKALEYKPDDADAYFNMACAYSLLKRKAEALENLQKAITLNVKNKTDAKTDKDFTWLWEDDEFKRITSD